MQWARSTDECLAEAFRFGWRWRGGHCGRLIDRYSGVGQAGRLWCCLGDYAPRDMGSDRVESRAGTLHMEILPLGSRSLHSAHYLALSKWLETMRKGESLTTASPFPLNLLKSLPSLISLSCVSGVIRTRRIRAQAIDLRTGHMLRWEGMDH